MTAPGSNGIRTDGAASLQAAPLSPSKAQCQRPCVRSGPPRNKVLQTDTGSALSEHELKWPDVNGTEGMQK